MKNIIHLFAYRNHRGEWEVDRGTTDAILFLLLITLVSAAVIAVAVAIEYLRTL